MSYSEYDKRVLPLALLIIIIIALSFAILLRGKSEKIRRIPTSAIAILLIVMEIAKQKWNTMGEIDYYLLPFHYCSLFLLVIPLAELFGTRLSRIFRPIALSMSFIVTGAMYIAPQGIITSSCEDFGFYFYETHTFIFHHLVTLYFILVIVLRLCKPRITDALRVGILGLVYSGAAIHLSGKFQVNYCNFLNSVIPQMESFRADYGQTQYTILMVLCLSVGTMLGSLILIGLYKLTSLLYMLIQRLTRKKG